MKFTLNIPTKIYFGGGILEEAIVKEKAYFSKTALIVSSKGTDKFGFNDRINGALKKIGAKSVSFSDITSNPKIEEINSGIDFAINHNVGAVIGIGGGSAMDSAKAIAAGAGMGEHIDRCFFENVQPDSRTLPIIAVPTTAGTGSELSKSGILSCPQRQIKSGVRGEHLYPAVAIVDPELTYTLPHKITMETGFDVLAHAVESYLSKASNHFTDILSERAIKTVSVSLRKLAEDINDFEAREKMSFSSMIMGINLGNASTVLPHRMQYPVGAMTDTGHAEGLAAIYPSWIEHTYSFSEEKFRRIGEWLSGNPCEGMSDVLDAFESFMRQTCGLPKLKSFGFSSDDAKKLADAVTGNIALDPAGDVQGIVYSIYKTALEK